jgi:hypothetical protein
MDKGGSVETSRAPTFYGLLYDKMDEQGGPTRAPTFSELFIYIYEKIEIKLLFFDGGR